MPFPPKRKMKDAKDGGAAANASFTYGFADQHTQLLPLALAKGSAQHATLLGFGGKE